MKKVLLSIFALALTAQAATIFECFWTQGTALNTGGTYVWTQELDPSNRLSYSSGTGWNGGNGILVRGQTDANCYLTRTVTATDTVCARFAFRDSLNLTNGQSHPIYTAENGGVYVVTVKAANISGNLRIILTGDGTSIDTSDNLTTNTTYQILVNYYRNQTGGVNAQIWNEAGTTQIGTTLTRSVTSANYDVVAVRLGDFEQNWIQANCFLSHITVDDATALSASTTGGCTPGNATQYGNIIDTVGNTKRWLLPVSGTNDSVGRYGTWPDSTAFINATANDSMAARWKAKFTKAAVHWYIKSCTGAGSDIDTVHDTITIVGTTPAYTNAPFTFSEDDAITTQSITSMAGVDSVTCGTLPTGLSLNKTTGDITGTPTTAQGAASVKFITWNNGWKVDSADISFTVTSDAAYTWIYNGTKFNADTSHTGQVVCTTKASMTKLYIWRLVKYDSLSSVSAGTIDSLNKPTTLYHLGGE